MVLDSNMVTNETKRPWNKKHSQGNRYNADPRYHTPQWRKARKAHILSNTTVTREQFVRLVTINPSLVYTNGTISNAFCIQCYLEGKLKSMHTVDHNERVKDGADFYEQSNYQSLCEHHHAQKSAREGNKQKEK